jgi:hypothetical protein
MTTPPFRADQVGSLLRPVEVFRAGDAYERATEWPRRRPPI